MTIREIEDEYLEGRYSFYMCLDMGRSLDNIDILQYYYTRRLMEILW